MANITTNHAITYTNICKPKEGWYGQPKYCYEKTIHVVLISFAVVFGLLVFGFCLSSVLFL